MSGLGPQVIKVSRGLTEKAVARWDEDPITMAGDASKTALQMADLPASDIGAIYLGSGSNPYVTRPAGSVVAEIIGTSPGIFCADCQFAGKSGTAALQICLALAVLQVAKKLTRIHCLVCATYLIVTHEY